MRQRQGGSGYDRVRTADGRPEKEGRNMAIDESTLTKGQARKLTALRRSVGDELGEEVFGKWMLQQAAVPTADPVARKIEEALAGFVGDGKLNLGVYGYTIRRARGKGATGYVATKNPKP